MPVSSQARRSTIRAEASRRISETRQLRVVLGAGVMNGSESVEGDWLMTDKNTLDVTDAADFE